MMRKSTLQLTILPSFRALGRKGGKPEVFEKSVYFQSCYRSVILNKLYCKKAVGRWSVGGWYVVGRWSVGGQLVLIGTFSAHNAETGQDC